RIHPTTRPTHHRGGVGDVVDVVAPARHVLRQQVLGADVLARDDGRMSRVAVGSVIAIGLMIGGVSACATTPSVGSASPRSASPNLGRPAGRGDSRVGGLVHLTAYSN